MIDNNTKKVNVNDLLKLLPQGSVIKPHHAQKWVETMLSRDDFHSIEWHVKRLAGIGGSESIVGLQKYAQTKGENLPDPFADPRSLVMQKLMMYVPSAASPKMLRGNRFEELIIERFCEQYGATIRQDIMDAVEEQSGKDPEHPWLVGNPDLIVEMSGRIYLVDIKAPDEAHEEFPFRYVAQLHHYREIMKRAGVLPHGMILGNFSWKDYAVKALEVDYDPEIAKGIIHGGDLLWDDVINGRVPELMTFESKKTPVPNSVMQDLQEEEKKYLRWKLVADKVNEHLEQHAEHIKEMVQPWAHEIDSKHGLVKGLELLTLQSRKKVNEDKLKALMAQRGIEDKWEEITKPSARYDVDAMKTALEQAGIDPEQFKIRTVDANKAVKILNDEGVSPEVLNASGVIEWSPSPVFRRPQRGPRVEKFAMLWNEVEPFTQKIEEAVESGEMHLGGSGSFNLEFESSTQSIKSSEPEPWNSPEHSQEASRAQGGSFFD